MPHTPKPWHIVFDRNKDFGLGDDRILIESNFGNVATVAGGDNPDDETAPNAAVLATAPEFKAACKAVVDAKTDKQQSRAFRQCKRALEKEQLKQKTLSDNMKAK